MAAAGRGKRQSQRVPSKKVASRKAVEKAATGAPKPARGMAPQKRKALAAPAPVPARGTAGEQPPPTVDFDEFFQRVGEGLVKAQQNMDAHSLDYLKGVSGQPQILPSLFRIPKLSADLKFALDTQNSKTVGFIFYKNETTQETRNQQSIKFDIVSVPATQIPAAPLFVNLLFSDVQRENVFAKLSETGDSTLMRALANKDRVLIYAPDGDRSYYVLYAEQGPATNIAFWYLLRDPVTLVTVRKFGDLGNLAGMQPWQQMLLKQADEQEKFLKKARQPG